MSRIIVNGSVPHVAFANFPAAQFTAILCDEKVKKYGDWRHLANTLEIYGYLLQRHTIGPILRLETVSIAEPLQSRKHAQNP